MDDLWIAVAFLVMEGAWMGGVLAVAGQAYGQHATAILPFPTAYLTLVAGYLAGRHLLHRGATPQPAPRSARRDGERARSASALALGCSWAVGAVWATRHAGGVQDATWLLALPAGLADLGSGLTPDLAAFAATLFGWWRGQRVGAVAPTFETVVRAFGVGSLLLSIALLVAAGRGSTPAGAGRDALLLLAAGLPALSLVRLREVRQEAVSGGGAAPVRVGVVWLGATAAPICAVLAVAGAVALGNEAWRRLLLELWAGAGVLLERLLYWPLVGLGHIAELLVSLLRWLLSRANLRPAEQSAQPLRDVVRLIEQPGPAGGLWLDVARWVVAGLVVLFAGGAFLLSSRTTRRQAHAPPAALDERESLWSWTDLWRRLTRWLAHRRGRWRAGLAGLAGRGVSPGGGRRNAGPGGGDARALYRRFLTLGRANGLSRAPADTPQEYLRAWRQSLPGAGEAGTLTDVYEQVRYASPERPPALAGDAAALRATLARLERRLAPGTPRSPG